MIVKILPRKTEKQDVKGGWLDRKSKAPSTDEGSEKSSGAGRSAATAIGVALVGAAGVTAAVRYLRHPNGMATFHVVPDGEDGWRIEDERAPNDVTSFGTKREALRAARTAAANAAPSQLVIHRADGSVSRAHRYEPT